MINVKKEAVKAALGVGFVLLLFFVIRYFKLSTLGIIGLLTVISLLAQTYSKIKDKKPFSFKETVKNFLYLVCVIHVIIWLSTWLGSGFWGVVIVSLVISLIILYKRRKQYLAAKHHIEAMIWKEPLYKYRNRGERPPKLKIKL